MEHNYNILLLGDKKVGKSAYIKRLSTGEFIENYVSDYGLVSDALIFETGLGKINFNLFILNNDKEVLEKHLSSESYKHYTAVIIMHDLTNPESLINAKLWIKDIRNNSNLPIVLCGNKFDSLSAKHLRSLRGLDVNAYYEISAKSNYNFEKPWLWIARYLSNNQDLQFI